MPTWPVSLRIRDGNDSKMTASSFTGDEVPTAGQIIDVADARAEVEEVTTGADGQPLIIADLLRD
jgi:hypothetical protein